MKAVYPWCYFQNLSPKKSAHEKNSATANRNGHDKFQLWVFFGIHIIHTIMTKSKAMKAMASCLALRQTCFRNSHLTFYDPCWKLITFSQTDLAPCKTRWSKMEVSPYTFWLSKSILQIKVPFGSFVFSPFFFHWVCIQISENILWVRTSCG